MQIRNARWVDETHEFVLAEIDGLEGLIPASPENQHFAALLEDGVEIAPPTPVDAGE